MWEVTAYMVGSLLLPSVSASSYARCFVCARLDFKAPVLASFKVRRDHMWLYSHTGPMLQS